MAGGFFLPMSDIIIVGGGVIGTMCALELRRAGADVTLLERIGIGQKSSWAGGGILSPLYPWRYPDAVSELVHFGWHAFPSIAKELREAVGIDPEWIPCGKLTLDADDQAAALAWARRYDMELISVQGSELAAMEPALSRDVTEALWAPQIAQVRSPRLLKALTARLKTIGVDVREHTPVRRIAVDRGRVRGVDTVSGRIGCERVIVAAGAWSSELLAASGVTLSVRPVRGQMLLFAGEPGLLQRIILCGDRYLIPRRDGRILVGSTVENVGFDEATTAAAHESLRATAVGLVAALDQVPLERHWAGLRPGSPNGVPFIGECPGIEGLFVNAGQHRNGFILAPGSAHLLTAIILRHKPILNPEPYRVGRLD